MPPKSTHKSVLHGDIHMYIIHLLERVLEAIKRGREEQRRSADKRGHHVGTGEQRLNCPLNPKFFQGRKVTDYSMRQGRVLTSATKWAHTCTYTPPVSSEGDTQYGEDPARVTAAQGVPRILFQSESFVASDGRFAQLYACPELAVPATPGFRWAPPLLKGARGGGIKSQSLLLDTTLFLSGGGGTRNSDVADPEVADGVDADVVSGGAQ